MKKNEIVVIDEMSENEVLDSVMLFLDVVLSIEHVTLNTTSRWAVEYLNVRNNQFARVFNYKGKTVFETWIHVNKDDKNKIERIEFCLNNELAQALDLSTYTVIIHKKDALKTHVKKCDRISACKLLETIANFYNEKNKVNKTA